ncbi:inactive dipeptidyl peptidase 10 isoform X2 [Orussus abietinus]|uniref:inactive dipeptidyl peptidase 10 isoform X2 n=1 Tax=Orussus abietinus TaxID=222816 RepID=UPI000626B142|nr:inactive dipeptidyl peptidase 10 isoform X2 [Orussus abietinus]
MPSLLFQGVSRTSTAVLIPFQLFFTCKDPIPGEQLVDKRWRLDWHEYAATNWNIVVVQVDARGAGYHSMNRIYSVKGRIPEIMVNDQISAIRYIAKKKKYLDIGKLLLVGEGLGGTIALIAASKFAPFISGVAVYNARLNLHNSTIGFTEKFIIPPKSENLSDLAASWNNTYTYISHCLNNQVCPCEEFYRLLYSFDPALNIHTMVYPEEWTPDYMGSSRKHFYFIMVKQACDKTVCHRQLSGQNASTDPEEEEEF